jgi:serine/threonine protein kinase
LTAKGGSLTEEECRSLIRKIVVGLKNLHDCCIIHRDLKPANILLHFKTPLSAQGRIFTDDDFLALTSQDRVALFKALDLSKTDFEVKIADLGFSKHLREDFTSSQMSMCGTPLFMSPQIVQEDNYTLKTDVWSLGALFVELLSG